jgi:hypothetical protein
MRSITSLESLLNQILIVFLHKSTEYTLFQ